MLTFYIDQPALARAAALVADELAIKLDADGLAVSYRPTEGRLVTVTDEDGYYRIEANGIARALWVLSQMVLRSRSALPMTFIAERSFDRNGLMLDNSRNGVANVTMVKRLLRKLALLGHNWYMLYMEDVYEVDGEPYFGLQRGRYSRQELKELDDYAAALGVELVPCIQTLAHINQFFMWEWEERKYRDLDDVLNIASEDTKGLLRRMLATLRDCFRTSIIHLGMDEAYNLGRGTYLDQCGQREKSQIMLEHLRFMQQLCREYSFKPIIWDDMFFSGYSNVEKQDSFAVPEGIGLMYWDYYNSSQEHYERRIQQRRRISDQVMFAGGAWRWTGYTPHHGKTLETTIASLQACKKHGVRTVIATSWSDDGCECPFFNCLFGLTLFGLLDVAEYDEAVFDQWLNFYTGMGLEAWMRQAALDAKPEFRKDAIFDTTPSKYLFYQDPIQSKFMFWTKRMRADYTEHLQRLAAEFASQTEGDADINHFYELYAKTLAIKWKLPLQIEEAYRAGDKTALRALMDDEIETLLNLIPQLAEARRKIWKTECKRFGMEVLDHRFGALVMRLHYAKELLTELVEQDTMYSEELEEPRLNPTIDLEDREPQATTYNRALRIMSAGKEYW
ncbi:MAG: family 20 glycosylhydrolase [Lachnospiraceae bacterium]|nr:family 20 glycosylhydrolase [Lachnospiraceae bacterium]MDY5742496.1 family 20 glycosylhydrolase [Lachnospiraceae bacterium]